MPSFSLSSMACWRSALSCDSPSVITIITFLAPRRPPCLKACELWEHLIRLIWSVKEITEWRGSEVGLLVCTNGDIVPCYIDAKSRVGLLSASLVDTARPFHHFLNRFVVAEFEFMDHLLTILNDSNLSGETQWQWSIRIDKSSVSQNNSLQKTNFHEHITGTTNLKQNLLK